MRTVLLLLGVGGLALASAAVAAGSAKSTAEERAQAVRYARELARDPMAAGAEQKRQWLVAWYERIPDITVTVCDLLGPLPPRDHPFFGKVLDQSLFSGGAFIIEHPERADDELAIQAAAMEGSLRVYEAYARSQPLYRLHFVDDLLARRKAGTLGAYLREAVPKGCLTAPSP
jgi:hypothetical protein